MFYTDKATYCNLFKVLLVSLLVNPRVDHFEVLRCQRFGFFLGQVTKLFVVRMLAHASCSSMPLAPFTPLPISYRHGGILLLEHGFLARLTHYGTLTARVCSFPDCKRFHLLPRTQALQVKRVGVKKSYPNHCSCNPQEAKKPLVLQVTSQMTGMSKA